MAIKTNRTSLYTQKSKRIQVILFSIMQYMFQQHTVAFNLEYVICIAWGILNCFKRDVINFLSCRRKNKSYRRNNRLAKRVSDLSQLGGIYGRGSGVNGAKSCMLSIFWHQICFLKYLLFLMDILIQFSKREEDTSSERPSDTV